jgi:O-antigen/teichoic acid export membrane protein
MLLQQSIIYVVAKLLPGLFGMLTTALLTRLLTPPEYGIFGLTLVVMTFGSNLAFDWLGLAFMRFFQARQDDPLILPTFGWIFTALAGLTGVVACSGLAVSGASSTETAAVAIGILLIWTSSWFELNARVPIARFQAVRYLLMNIGRAVFVMVGTVGTAWATRDPLMAGLGMAGGLLAGTLAGGRVIVPIRNRFDIALAKTIIMFGLPLAASMAMTGLINSGTRALIELLDSSAALGLYTATYMLVQNTLSVIAAGIASAGYSLAVRAVDSGDPMSASRQLSDNGTLLLAVLAPAALAMGLMAQDIAATLVGPHYVAGVAHLTPWMAAGTFFGGVRAHYLDHAFQLGHKSHLQVWVTVVAAIWAVGLSIWLIPREGPNGAAMAMTVAMAFSCVHAWLAGKHAYPLPFPGVALVRIALACGVMGGLILAVPGHGLLPLIARVAVGGVGYATVALAANLLDLRSMLLRRWMHHRLPATPQHQTAPGVTVDR